MTYAAAPLPRYQQGRHFGTLLLALVVACILAFSWKGINELFVAWWKAEYSHGWIIAPIAVFLGLRILRDLPEPAAAPNRVPGAVLTFAGLIASLLGNLAAIPDVITYGMLLALGGVILFAAGWRAGLRFWPAWAYLLFMLPLPNFLYWPLSIQLQFISSTLGVAGIKAMGIPVYLEGNIIDLGTYQLQVAEACNGLRYLFPLMSFGFLLAVLYRGPKWHKAVLFFSTIPITLLMNSARISIIGALVDQFGISQAEGFLHFFEGWIIFAACVALLYLLAVLMQRLTASPQRWTTVFNLEATGVFSSGRVLGGFPVTKTLMGFAAAVIGSVAVWFLYPAREADAIERQQFSHFPMQLEGWDGAQQELDLRIERTLAASDYLLVDYHPAKTGELPVNLFVAYYSNQQNSSGGIHSPEVCIPGSGWEVSRWEPTDVTLSAAAGGTFKVNRAIIQKESQKQIVYYWFEQQGVRFTSDYVAKAYQVYLTIKSGRSDGALIRFITPVGKDGIAAADQRLIKLMNETIPHLARFVPP